MKSFFGCKIRNFYQVYSILIPNNFMNRSCFGFSFGEWSIKMFFDLLINASINFEVVPYKPPAKEIALAILSSMTISLSLSTYDLNLIFRKGKCASLYFYRFMP